MKNILSTTVARSIMVALSLSTGGLFSLGASSAQPLPQDERPSKERTPLSHELLLIREAELERVLKQGGGIAFVKVISDTKKDEEHVIRTYEVILPIDSTFKKGETLVETVYYEGGLYNADGSVRIKRFKPQSVLLIQTSLKKSDSGVSVAAQNVREIETISPAYFFASQFEKTWKRIHRENPQLLPAIP